MRRLQPLLAAAILAALLLPVGLASGASASVTGSLVTRERIALSPDAVAVVTIVDQTAGGRSGTIVGLQRIPGAQFPVAFSVPYDTASINPDRSYAVYASIADGDMTWSSIEPVPVITGGPTSDVVVTMAPKAPDAAGRVSVTIRRQDRSALTPDAVALAALIRKDTGAIVATQSVLTITGEPIQTEIRFDPGVLNPSATYVVRAAIVDGSRRWTGPAVTALTNGATTGQVTVNVSLVEPSPTPRPTATPEPTPSPSPRPTAEPTATAPPTPTATASPEPSPSASPKPTASASPAPSSGTISGRLRYGENHELSDASRAIVVLVQGSSGPQEGKIVGREEIIGTGPEPVSFTLTYDWSAINPDKKYFLWAGIQDGTLAWVTTSGTRVDVPAPSITGVKLDLQFRPDVLKASVSGTVTGVGLDTTGPAAYLTVSIVRVDTGETIGFQAIAPPGPTPVLYAVPYDPDAIKDGKDYVVMATADDGTDVWETPAGVPVITKGNAVSGVVLTLVGPSPTPSPSPTPTPTATPTATPSPTVTPSPAPSQTTGDASGTGDDGGSLLVWLVLIALAVVGAGAGVAWYRSRAA